MAEARAAQCAKNKSAKHHRLHHRGTVESSSQPGRICLDDDDDMSSEGGARLQSSHSMRRCFSYGVRASVGAAGLVVGVSIVGPGARREADCAAAGGGGGSASSWWPFAKAERRRRVALFGGAFDPPTNGHLQCCAGIIHSELADEVWMVPCGPRPDKASSLAIHGTLAESFFAHDHAGARAYHEPSERLRRAQNSFGVRAPIVCASQLCDRVVSPPAKHPNGVRPLRDVPARREHGVHAQLPGEGE